MAGKIQLTPAELLAQSQEMLSLQQEFEGLFQKTSSVLEQVNSDWSENLANNFVGKLTSAQKSFVQVVSMLAQGGSVAATSAKSFESIDSLLAKNMAGDGWSVTGTAAGIVASVASAASGAAAHLGSLDPSFAGMPVAMATSAGQYNDQNIIEFLIDDFERHPEIWNDFKNDLLKLIHIDVKIGEMIWEDIKNGEFNLETVWKIGSEIGKNWTEGKVIVGTLENLKQLKEQVDEDTAQSVEYWQEGNILAGVNTMVGSAINTVIVGSIDVGGDIIVDLWDGFPGTNMIEHVFGFDASESWNDFTEWAHEGVDEITEFTSEVIATVEEGAREVVDTVVDIGKEVGKKAGETVEAIGDGLEAVGDWIGSWW